MVSTAMVLLSAHHCASPRAGAVVNIPAARKMACRVMAARQVQQSAMSWPPGLLDRVVFTMRSTSPSVFAAAVVAAAYWAAAHCQWQQAMATPQKITAAAGAVVP